MQTETDTGHSTPPETNANGADPVGVIEQVRELLFGEAKRSTEHGLSTLEAKIDALAATMHERFSEVENRIAELARNTEHARTSAIDEIGDAIGQLGATIRNMSGARKAN